MKYLIVYGAQAGSDGRTDIVTIELSPISLFLDGWKDKKHENVYGCPLVAGWTVGHVRAKGYNGQSMPDYGQACWIAGIQPKTKQNGQTNSDLGGTDRSSENSHNIKLVCIIQAFNLYMYQPRVS